MDTALALTMPRTLPQPAPVRALRSVAPLPAEQPAATVPTTDWRSAAIAAYWQDQPDAFSAMVADLRLRLLDLIGRAPDAAAVIVDRFARTAQVAIDGVIFRLQDQDLVLLRGCAACGLRQYVSPPIRSRADLGYALAIWEPRCPDCEPEDPREW
ncbi:MAG: hypothetical protein IT340_03845 [Chloroflexi bacterium]|nr:hypothetical protein [Chloroflexota bacterium]